VKNQNLDYLFRLSEGCAECMGREFYSGVPKAIRDLFQQ